VGHFFYRWHFVALVVGAGVLWGVTQLDLFREPFVPTFALNGVLYGAALALTARGKHTLLHRLLFVGIGTVLSVATLYVGIAGMQLFAVLPAGIRLYEVLALCAAVGALAYGMLIRTFWIPGIAPRAILLIGVCCTASAVLALWVRGFVAGFDAWWLTATWWFTLSGALYYLDTHLGSNPRFRSRVRIG
jgi:hypothetical protein